jgi:hypothetical protein
VADLIARAVQTENGLKGPEKKRAMAGINGKRFCNQEPLSELPSRPSKTVRVVGYARKLSEK